MTLKSALSRGDVCDYVKSNTVATTFIGYNQRDNFQYLNMLGFFFFNFIISAFEIKNDNTKPNRSMWTIKSASSINGFG